MTDQDLQPAINKWRLWMWLTVVGIFVSALEVALSGLFDQGAISRIDISIIAAVTWFTTMISTLPVIMLGPKGVIPTMTGYMVGMGVKMVTCLLFAFTAMYLLQATALSLLVGMIGLYLVLLAVETAFVARYLWQKDFLAAATGETMEIRT